MFLINISSVDKSISVLRLVHLLMFVESYFAMSVCFFSFTHICGLHISSAWSLRFHSITKGLIQHLLNYWTWWSRKLYLILLTWTEILAVHFLLCPNDSESVTSQSAVINLRVSGFTIDMNLRWQTYGHVRMTEVTDWPTFYMLLVLFLIYKFWWQPLLETVLLCSYWCGLSELG